MATAGETLIKARKVYSLAEDTEDLHLKIIDLRVELKMLKDDAEDMQDKMGEFSEQMALLIKTMIINTERQTLSLEEWEKITRDMGWTFKTLEKNMGRTFEALDEKLQKYHNILDQKAVEERNQILYGVIIAMPIIWILKVILF